MATIHLYRPQRTDPDHLEAIFVARQPLVEEVLDRLRQWRPAASRQHYLFLGPRGIGKTCTLLMIRHRILTGDLRGKWVPIALPEEGYGIRSVADLLIATLEIACQELDDPELQQAYHQLRRDTDDQRVVDLALDAFRRYHLSTGKGVLLLLENVNRIFDRQIRDRRQRGLLRKILIEEDWLVVICTSPTYVSAVTSANEPLFEFFQVKLLGELTLEEQESMLRKLAQLEHNEVVQEYLHQFRSRLQALYHFTGGNPRLAVMLYDLIAHQRITAVQDELDSLLDQLTPFYQDRMGDLAEQEAKLLEQMALLPEGCTPTELARESRMPAKTVRALLGRLEDSGYVRREQRRKKQTVYIIPERFFRIWHQMGHSRAARGRAQYLLEFFSTWYSTRQERDQVWNDLVQELQEGSGQEEDEERNADLAAFMQYIAAASEGTERYERQFGALKLVFERDGATAMLSQLEDLERECGDDADYHLYKGCFLAEELADHHAALSAFDEAIRLSPADPASRYNRAVALDKLGETERATKDYQLASVYLTDEPEGAFSEETQKLLVQILTNSSRRELVHTATSLLGRIADGSITSQVISVAKTSTERWRRRFCANALGMLGGEESRRTCLDLLQDPAPEVRGGAATALGRIGSKQAVPALIACLDDEANNVRGGAATALGNIGSEQAVPALIACLNDADGINRGSAATALGKIGSEQAVPALIACLNDEDSTNRGSAATALGKIGSEQAVPALIACLNDEDSTNRGSAATALGKIGSEQAVPALIARLDDEANNVRGGAATALGKIGSEQAAPALIACLNDEDSINRGSAATALGKIGSEQAVPTLIACLDDEDSITRVSAAIALGRIGADSAIGPLLEVVKSRSGDERLSAVTAIGRIAANRVVPQLSNVLETLLDEWPVDRPGRAEVAQQLLRSAWRSANPPFIRQAVDVVRSHLPDGADVCAPHEAALEYLDSDRDAAILERQYPEMREAVELLIDSFDHPEH